jgi:hypothetical protein
MMKLFVVVALAVVASALTDQEQWDAFKHKYNRVYNSVNDQYRFQVFQANLRIAEQLQAADKSAVYGVTQFMDLTPSEFKIQFTGLNVSDFKAQRHKERVPLLHARGKRTGFGTNWRNSAVTAVKNQGQCGSCWSFSATGAMEGCWATTGHGLVSMSESNILDCMPGNAGCNGGDPRAAINWAAKNGGLMTEAAYPYVPRQQSCHQGTPRYGPTKGAVSVGSSETSIRSALATAPLSICVDATPLQYYNSGIISGASCNYRNTDHAILLVADDSNVYTFKNSWATSWGEAGYFRTAQGSNCLNMIDYVTRAC